MNIYKTAPETVEGQPADAANEPEATHLNTPYFHKKKKFKERGWIYSAVKSGDIFGDPVQVYYKGETTVKSVLGGAATVVVKVLMLAYILLQTNSLISSEDSNLSSISMKSQVVKDLQPIILREHGISNDDIKFGVNIRKPENDSDTGGINFEALTNKYFVFKAHIIDNDFKVFKTVSIFSCTMDSENPGRSESLFQQTFCLDSYYESLMGTSSSSKDSRKLQIMMKRCSKEPNRYGEDDPDFKNVDECATDQEFSDMLSNVNVFMEFRNNIVDFTQFKMSEEPYFKRSESIFYDFIDNDLFNSGRYDSIEIPLRVNEVSFQQKLLSLGSFQLDFLDLQLINKRRLNRGDFKNSEQIIREVVFSLDETGVRHKRIIYGFADFLMNLGGLWFGLTLLGGMGVRFLNSDKFARKIAKQFYRKPEVYKYAHAKKVDYAQVAMGLITLEEYQKKQQDLNNEALKLRTKQELEGKIFKPNIFQRVFYTLKVYLDLPRDLMTKVDLNCFDKAKMMITNEMLDVRFLGDQTRQNYWLKDLFFTKVQMQLLEGSYRKVIDPRTENALKKDTQKQSANPLERMQLEDSSSEPEVSDEDNQIDEFVDKFYKDFKADKIIRNAKMQQMLLIKENEFAYKRIENALKAALYDQSYLMSEDIRKEKASIRAMLKSIDPKQLLSNQSKEKAKPLVTPLTERLSVIQKAQSVRSARKNQTISEEENKQKSIKLLGSMFLKNLKNKPDFLKDQKRDDRELNSGSQISDSVLESLSPTPHGGLRIRSHNSLSKSKFGRNQSFDIEQNLGIIEEQSPQVPISHRTRVQNPLVKSLEPPGQPSPIHQVSENTTDDIKGTIATGIHPIDKANNTRGDFGMGDADFGIVGDQNPLVDLSKSKEDPLAEPPAEQDDLEKQIKDLNL